MESYALTSTSDGKGGVYITKMDKNGYMKIYYCADGSKTEVYSGYQNIIIMEN